MGWEPWLRLDPVHVSTEECFPEINDPQLLANVLKDDNTELVRQIIAEEDVHRRNGNDGSGTSGADRGGT